ncbi:importin-7 [Ctenocephalides felis]|uniref:importin-7 n=1 Tax=Ctenocephalides felis TaxID=7515 RepID=UPI000E6E3516|nr:importin-7 [Ctenocephalides felis]
MDNRKLIELLRATIEPSQRQQAEDQLAQIHKIIGFAPTLLQVVMMNDVDMPVRQAGVIYLKNMVTNNWADRETEAGQPMPFSIHEQDRAMIRDAIVDAVVHATELIRTQLSVCVNIMVKHDFPGRWTQIVDKISIYLQNPDPTGWAGALLCLYQLVKIFEYKKIEERQPLTEAMNLLLPMLYNIIVRLLPDQSEQSVLLQKQILKIYFALTQYSLPLNLITQEMFSQWMEVTRAIADSPVPESTLQTDEDERMELPWWKCKKWAMHILHRMFERYGSPGNVTKEYTEFAEWYLKTFSAGILEVQLKILDQYRNKMYISPRVLQQCLNYVDLAVSHAFSWKFLKPHMFAIVQDVLFPILSHSEADEELFVSDPHEYIRVKFDIFEDYISPVTAAQTLLGSCCRKRKDMLQKTMQLVMQVLTSPQADDRQKDGALHMVGALAEILLKKKFYKDQMDSLLMNYVFPEFSHAKGHMRARACWVLHYFSEIKFKQEDVLATAVNLTTNALLTDKELPVKVEAAIALQMILAAQSRAEKYVEPRIKEITMELLRIIRETENDDLTSVMQKVVCTYTTQLLPIAVEICQHLAQTFSQVIESEENSDEKAITAMGLLNTIETLLSVMEDNEEIIANLQPTVLQVVGHIFQQSVMDLYEEALSLVYDLTQKKISPDMWQVLELIYQVFQNDGFDFFTDMMPVLHNYVTVDSDAFISNENHVLALFNMCKAVLTGDAGEDPEAHAAKLLEVIILQCKGRIDQCIPPIIELVLNRLTREIQTSELRAMCLQVVIAALYYNPPLLFSIMDKLPMPVASAEPIASHFIKQWFQDADCFLGLHDRKLCVLGICTLISLGDLRPPALAQYANQVVPTLILLFDGLKRAYAAKAAEDAEEEETEEQEESCEEEVLSSDEDEIDEQGQMYLEKLQDTTMKKANAAGVPISTAFQDCDSESDYDLDNEETTLETYTTPIDDEDNPVDEYVIFKEIITNLQGQDPQFYAMLTSHLTPQQQESVKDIFTLADQRKAAANSKKIEQSGGYSFPSQTVPTTFNFGSTG